MKYRGKSIDTIIWLQTSFLGDIILSTAAFNLARKLYPDCRQVLITTPLGVAALKKHPSLDHILVFDKKKTWLPLAARAIKKKLKSLDLGAAVLLQAHKSHRSSFLSMALNLPRVCYDEASFAWGAGQVPRVACLHESFRVALLLEPLGVSRQEIVSAVMSLPPLILRTELQEKLGKKAALRVAISPGSVWGTKRWLPKRFAELAEKLLQDGHQIILIGSGNEAEEAAPCRQRLGGKDGFIDLLGQTSLDDLRGIYPQLDLLICNDSSPIHYASAFGVKTLAIFGATVPAMGFGPRAKGSEVVELSFEHVPCRPCSDHGPKTCPLSHFDCMSQLATQTVYDRATAILKNS